MVIGEICVNWATLPMRQPWALYGPQGVYLGGGDSPITNGMKQLLALAKKKKKLLQSAVETQIIT